MSNPITMPLEFVVTASRPFPLGKHLGDAEFGGEVRDEIRGVAVQALVPARFREIAVQIRRGRLDPGHHVLVPRHGPELLARDGPQKGHGIVPALVPQHGMQALEELAGRKVPGPAEIVRQSGQWGDRFGQDGSDGESADGLHVRHTNRVIRPSEQGDVSFW